MKTYTLLNPEKIEKISTHTDGCTAFMTVHYKKIKEESTKPEEYSILKSIQNWFSNSNVEHHLYKEHEIGFAVQDLLNEGLIDNELASIIKKDYLHLFSGITFPELDSKIPFKCTDSLSAEKETTNLSWVDAAYGCSTIQPGFDI